MSVLNITGQMKPFPRWCISAFMELLIFHALLFAILIRKCYGYLDIPWISGLYTNKNAAEKIND